MIVMMMKFLSDDGDGMMMLTVIMFDQRSLCACTYLHRLAVLGLLGD